MIDMTSVQSVVQRIADIEYQIGLRRPKTSGGASFQQAMEAEMQKQNPARETPPKAAAAPLPALPGPASIAPRFFNGKTPVAKPPTSSADSVGAPYPGRPETFSSTDVGTADLEDTTFFDTIREAAWRHNVDPKLVQAVAEVESGFNQDAVSSVGAVGVMQLMPETAESLGVNPYDAAQNIEGGAKYLRQLLDSFHGDVRKAVAAYNAGPQAVRDYGGVPPYSETQTYVDSVLDLYR